MIATVTLNPAMDKTMIVPGFRIGGTNRGQVERVDIGGKGINVARAARRLGCAVTALGFAADAEGRGISEALAAEGIASDFVRVPGKTRVNLKIKDPRTGTETEINEPGFPAGAEPLARLEGRIREAAGRRRVMVFSGSLPPGVPAEVYAGFIRIAAARGARTILDTGGAALKSGLGACPDLVKPNRAEAEELLGGPLTSEAELLKAGREMLGMGARAAVISLGKEGALGVTAAESWRVRAPAVKAASSIAAGDAMVAALAYAMLKDLPFKEAVRLAVAAGTATAGMSGSGVAGREPIEELLPRVEVSEA